MSVFDDIQASLRIEAHTIRADKAVHLPVVDPAVNGRPFRPMLLSKSAKFVHNAHKSNNNSLPRLLSYQRINSGCELKKISRQKELLKSAVVSKMISHQG